MGKRISDYSAIRCGTYSRYHMAVRCQRGVGSVGKSARSLIGSDGSTVPATGSFEILSVKGLEWSGFHPQSTPYVKKAIELQGSNAALV